MKAARETTEFKPNELPFPSYFTCTSCGTVFREADDDWGSKNTSPDGWDFCPKCGREIKREADA